MQIMPVFGYGQTSKTKVNKGNTANFKGYNKAFNQAFTRSLPTTYQVDNMFFDLLNALKKDRTVETNVKMASIPGQTQRKRLYDILEELYVKAKSSGFFAFSKESLAKKQNEGHDLLSISTHDGSITFVSPSNKNNYIRLSTDKTSVGEIKVQRFGSSTKESMVFYDSRQGESGVKIISNGSSRANIETRRFRPNGEEINYSE